MRIGPVEIKRRVWIFLLFALASSGAWWVWTKSAIPAVTTATKHDEPVVRLATTRSSAENTVMGERAVYLDPTPLFFPTEWNYGQGELRESLKRQPGQVFGGFDAKYLLAEPGIKPYDTDAGASSQKIAEIVAAGNEAPFDGFGEIKRGPPVLDERAGYLEVRRLKDGKIVIAQALASLPASSGDFVPMEFIAVVSASGLVGEPVLTSVATRDETSAGLRGYLSGTIRLGERLGPGIYRIVIGP